MSWRATSPVPRHDFFKLPGSVMANAFEFIQNVRAEAAKVVWPTRRETIVTSLIVIAMAAAASLFFVFADEIIRLAISFILSFGH